MAGRWLSMPASVMRPAKPSWRQPPPTFRDIPLDLLVQLGVIAVQQASTMLACEPRRVAAMRWREDGSKPDLSPEGAQAGVCCVGLGAGR